MHIILQNASGETIGQFDDTDVDVVCEKIGEWMDDIHEGYTIKFVKIHAPD